MKLIDLLTENYKEILISLVFVMISMVILFLLATSKSKAKGRQIAVGSIITFLILGGLNYVLIKNMDIPTEIEFSEKYVLIISPILRLILTNIALLSLYSLVIYNVFNSNLKVKEKLTTSKIAFLGIIVGVSSILMIFSLPIFPPAPFLKVEISALIIYMVFLWFGIKNAIIVSLLTNFIHVFMPGTPPIIPFLDEGINFIATMAFILPSYIYFKHHDVEKVNNREITILTLTGIAVTTVFMVLYNAFFNLPVVYGLKMTILQVFLIFGSFNILKWGLVSLSIMLLWKKLYILKDIRKE